MISGATVSCLHGQTLHPQLSLTTFVPQGHAEQPHDVFFSMISGAIVVSFSHGHGLHPQEERLQGQVEHRHQVERSSTSACSRPYAHHKVMIEVLNTVDIDFISARHQKARIRTLRPDTRLVAVTEDANKTTATNKMAFISLISFLVGRIPKSYNQQCSFSTTLAQISLDLLCWIGDDGEQMHP